MAYRILENVAGMMKNDDPNKVLIQRPTPAWVTTQVYGGFPNDVERIEERNGGLNVFGYVFADPDDISRNILNCYDISDASYKFEYVKNGIVVKVCIPVGDYDETKRMDIVYALAKAYEKAMIERKSGMKYVEYVAVVNKVKLLGGEVEIKSVDLSSGVNYVPNVTINIPMSALKHIHFGEYNDKETSKPVLLNKEFHISDVKVQDVKFFNDRATVVTFTDGTQTRSVCDKEDHFSKDVGIAYCLFKRFLGGEKAGHARFNDLMRQARKALEDRKAEEKEAQKNSVRESSQKAKQMEAAKRRKEKKRQEKVDLIAEAIRKSQVISVRKRRDP